MKAFAKVFNTTPDDLDMHMIYDVSHNVAKVEEHVSFLHIYLRFPTFSQYPVYPTVQSYVLCRGVTRSPTTFKM